MYIINKNRNYKGVFIVLVTTILNCIAMVSCVKESNLDIIEVPHKFNINIKTEDFGDDGVKSSYYGGNNILFSDTIETSLGPTEITLSEDADCTSNSNLPNTKANTINYTIKIYEKLSSGYKYLKSFNGTVNNEGDFRFNSTPTLPAGNYAFLCITNEAINNNAFSAIFTQDKNKDIAPERIAMISQVIEKNITDINERVVLDFIMQHVQTGFRVELTGEVKSGIKICAEDVMFNNDRQLTYNLNTQKGVLTNGANSKPISIELPISNSGNREYLYTMLTEDVNSLSLYLEKAGNIEERFTIKHAFKKNKRYTITISVDNNKYPDLKPEEVKELPGWRWAPREIKINSNNLRSRILITNEADYDEGAWMLDVAQAWYGKGKNVVLYDNGKVFDNGRKYHLPSVEELAGIFPFSVSNLHFNGVLGPLISIPEPIQIGNTLLGHYDSKYWSRKDVELSRAHGNDTTVVKYDFYGIKLYKKEIGDYSRACAYRYQWYNHESVPMNSKYPYFNAHFKVSIIYLGKVAKKYLQNNDENEIVDLFNKMDNGSLNGYITNTINFNGAHNYGYYALYPQAIVITNDYSYSKNLLSDKIVYSVKEGGAAFGRISCVSGHDYDKSYQIFRVYVLR